ncbi:hypothetical protein BC939DRAFT_96174 [Gamsiella multidivaricata]|uniref:uncharacterized protein n=1 Tax=Gamsiella multidivaricata TaxID=101098 RepID=UPI00221F56F2|nr:uncharacterized protein BC939DRAFT_96174 [Gamsiella multidivaricata]KAI7827162.1 hypothetical protein BC939DRAFT_96174 [Gamsiella multidivaricata]
MKKVFSQVFLDLHNPEVAVLRCKKRFAVCFDSGVCLWQVPSSRDGSFTLLSFEPSDDLLSWLMKTEAAVEEAIKTMEGAPIVDHSMLMLQLEAWKDELKTRKDELEAQKDELKALKVNLRCHKTKDDDIEYPVLCNHGKILRWPRNKRRPVITLDISQSYYFGDQETLKCIKFIPSLLKSFIDGEDTATFNYLMRHINRYPDHSDSINNSVIGVISLHCKANAFEFFLQNILKGTKRSWVPHASLFSRDPEKNIFGILLKNSERTMIRTLAEYMLASSRRAGNSGYLDILLTSLPHIAKKDPSMALWITRQAVFLPSDYRRTDLKQDAVLNNPPWSQSPLWKRVSASLGGFQEFRNELHEYANPIFQVQSQLPLTFGPSSLSPEPRCFPKEPEYNTLNEQIQLDFYMIPISLAFSVQAIDKAALLPNTAEISFLSWIGRWSKMHLVDFSHAPTVICHSLPLEVYDSPALQAIMEYKCRFGRVFWILRFTFQIVYYILVLTVSFS